MTGKEDGNGWRPTGKQLAAGALWLLGLLVIVFLAVRGHAAQPPTAVESTALVLLAGLLELAGTLVGFSTGRADPTLARSAVRRLIRLANRAKETELVAQSAYESNSDKNELHETLGQVSVSLSYIGEGALDAINDWREFHGAALIELGAEEPQDGTHRG